MNPVKLVLVQAHVLHVTLQTIYIKEFVAQPVQLVIMPKKKVESVCYVILHVPLVTDIQMDIVTVVPLVIILMDILVYKSVQMVNTPILTLELVTHVMLPVVPVLDHLLKIVLNVVVINTYIKTNVD